MKDVMAPPAIRIMLLTAPTSYRATAFMQAARRLNLETVRVVDLPDELAERPHGYDAIDFRNISDSTDYLPTTPRQPMPHATSS